MSVTRFSSPTPSPASSHPLPSVAGVDANKAGLPLGSVIFLILRIKTVLSEMNGRRLYFVLLNSYIED